MTAPAAELDDVDWAILDELQADGRLSYNELARRVSMSPPAVAERVRRLEGAGVITGYHARVDATAVGHEVGAFVQMRCAPGRCLLKTSTSSTFPEVIEVHKLSGDHCSMLRVRTSSLRHLESMLERLGVHGEMRTSVVLSTQHEHRTVTRPPADDDLPVADAPGWSGPAEAS